MIIIEPAVASQFPQLIAVWESSVRATHFFLQERDIRELRPLLLSHYLPNVEVVIARDATGTIHGFLGVNKNRIEMLFVAAQSQGKGIGKRLLQHAIHYFAADELDVNEQNPQAVGFYRHMGFAATGRSEKDGQGNPFPLIHMKYSG